MGTGRGGGPVRSHFGSSHLARAICRRSLDATYSYPVVQLGAADPRKLLGALQGYPRWPGMAVRPRPKKGLLAGRGDFYPPLRAIFRPRIHDGAPRASQV